MIVFLIIFAALCTYKAWRWWDDEQRSKAEHARGERSFAGLVLTPTEIVRDGRERKPVAGVTANVETVGQLQRRITATRLAAIGVFALAMQKKRDDRELYLTITGPTFEWLIELQPDLGSNARRFASAINHAGRSNS